MGLSSVGRRWLALLLVALAFAVRLHRLGAQSFWFDEGWSWHLAGMPLAQMIDETASDRSPVLYYLLLHWWMAAGGTSEFTLRALSVFADVATVALLTGFARTMARAQFASLLPAVLWVINPFAIWYAQEARMYALVCALCTASSWYLWRWWRGSTRHAHRASGFEDPLQLAPAPASIGSGRRMFHISAVFAGNRELVISCALLAFAIHTHYYAVFLLPAQALCALVFGGGALRRTAVALLRNQLIGALAVVACVLLWLIYARRGLAYNDGFFSPVNTIDGRIGEWFTSFINGGGPALPMPAWGWMALVACLVLAVIRFAMARQLRALLMLMALGPAALLAATIAVRLFFASSSVFHPRYLIYVGPVLCLMGGVSVSFARRKTEDGGWESADGRRIPSSVLSLMTLLVLATLWLPVTFSQYTDPRAMRDDTRAAVRHVVDGLEPGDAVLMSRDNFAARYYWLRESQSVRGLPALYAAPYDLHGVLRSIDTVLRDINTNKIDRVRLLLWQDDVVDPQKLVESLLWNNGYELGQTSFGSIRLPLYRMERWPLMPPAIQTAQAAFEGGLNLTGTWVPQSALRGHALGVVLRWQPQARLRRTYKVFVHVLDQTGRLVFQRDKASLNALVPTTQWKVGEALQDPFSLLIPPDLPAGDYRVVIGVYDPLDDDRRLTVRAANTNPAGDAVEIATVRITQ